MATISAGTANYMAGRIPAVGTSDIYAYDREILTAAKFNAVAATIPEVDELKKQITELQEWALPINMIVKCEYCGRWAIRGFECVKCGAPINLKPYVEKHK